MGFLGVVIELERIKMEDKKVKGILDWPTLKGVKDKQKFLEHANYYCWFIKTFATIARLLHNIVRKNQKWKKLKEKFTRKLVLAVLDLDKKIRMKVNILNYTTEGVLSIKYDDGK